MDDYEAFYRLTEARQRCFGDRIEFSRDTFAADNGRVRQLSHARRYVQQWKTMKAQNIGLLFWGMPGTGKTFAAACIANAFLESDDPFAPTVMMATFGSILSRLLAQSPQEREEYLARLTGCDLLILDDLGMERQTDYANEQVFGIIDGRYLSRRPLIATTNLTLQELKDPPSLARKRIYDRLLELCVPVCFDGGSLRREKAAAKMAAYRQLMEQE